MSRSFHSQFSFASDYPRVYFYPVSFLSTTSLGDHQQLPVFVLLEVLAPGASPNFESFQPCSKHCWAVSEKLRFYICRSQSHHVRTSSPVSLSVWSRLLQLLRRLLKFPQHFYFQRTRVNSNLSYFAWTTYFASPSPRRIPHGVYMVTLTVSPV